ncbi:hypothetical protein Ddye_020292 [Dipteronia dyeriana]|uniref:Uncharacterized protein n=1 Tax=Dipteronia dyeriana TaxID=168575 RepID=A0AAD9TZN4_9ROSI|nr:hypothetical protein Ddye_020292 [Dipteronia dyeriana]
MIHAEHHYKIGCKRDESDHSTSKRKCNRQKSVCICALQHNWLQRHLPGACMESPRIVFAYKYMGTLINREGWSNGSHPERANTVYSGEYKCMGPGATRLPPLAKSDLPN